MSRELIPQSDPELRAWATNLLQQLPNFVADLSIAPQDLNEVTNLLTGIVTQIDAVQAAEMAYRAAVDARNTAKDQGLSRMRLHIASWKTRPNYNSAIGNSLGVITSSKPKPVWSDLKPEPRAKKTANGIEISYVRGQADGVLVFCKRGNETEFTQIDKDLRSPFRDRRPNLNNSPSELRQYYLVYFKGDEAVGQPSDVIQLAV